MNKIKKVTTELLKVCYVENKESIKSNEWNIKIKKWKMKHRKKNEK